MFARLGDVMFVCLSILGLAMALCEAQDLGESSEFAKQQPSDKSAVEDRLQKQQESIEVLMKQVGDMGMLLENYRRVIVNGVTESNDICAFIETLSSPDDKSGESEWQRRPLESNNHHDNFRFQSVRATWEWACTNNTSATSRTRR
jgi:hypothetical protein